MAFSVLLGDVAFDQLFCWMTRYVAKILLGSALLFQFDAALNQGFAFVKANSCVSFLNAIKAYCKYKSSVNGIIF